MWPDVLLIHLTSDVHITALSSVFCAQNCEPDVHLIFFIWLDLCSYVALLIKFTCLSDLLVSGYAIMLLCKLFF